ncbi:MAG TPA: M15 family metallopeptidase, partial [Longimicrobiales bacterium]
GIAVVGRVLERVTGEPFAERLESAVLAPLGMRSSAFEPRAELLRHLATAYMWGYDGRRFEAPVFELGMAPAGSMYSTVTDLARLLSMLFAGGRASSGAQVLSRESLEEMWRPQFAAPGEVSGYGLGFGISELEGRRRIGHGGAIYGFATELAALPDEKLGVVAITTVDAANAVTDRIADAALRLMLALRQGRPLPVPDTTVAVPADLAATLPGRYALGDWTIEVVNRDGHLFFWPGPAGLRVALRSLRDTLIIDDRLMFGPQVLVDGDRLIIGPDTFTRAPIRRPEPAPERWLGLIGEYGPDHDVLYILEKDGRLHALIEWFFLYPLREASADTFAFPDWGLYAGERLVFVRGADGRASAVELGGIRFQRRAVGAEDGTRFRSRRDLADNPEDFVRRDILDALRRIALAEQAPAETGDFREPELVDLAPLDPTLRFDIRYATTNNFLGLALYRQARAFLQKPAAEALLRAHRRLAQYGYGLIVFDAYRPWYVTKMFWEATPEEQRIFVADPSRGSRHNRGCAVDVTLYDLLTGEPVEMVSGYDEFSPRAYPDYPGGTARQRWHRELLRRVMEAEGFRVYDAEWWHFDYKDWRQYPILNVPFERIDG